MRQVEEQNQTNRDLNMVISLRMNKIQKYDIQRAKLEQDAINQNLIKEKTDRLREMRNERQKIKHQLIEDNINRNHEEARRYKNELSLKLKHNSDKDSKDTNSLGNNNKLGDNVDIGIEPEKSILENNAIHEDSLDFLSKSIMMSNFKAE